ncbi:hypothetical protein PR202_ga22831 [Eleusine coracana subsp. coracana]|uniref:Uncharacterized protein n=1 Tax=Eleusine coracana subsp. coracana TaxID=191504 RepID=A0AAV5D478_ELECO|nr:hypothetical protein PR202_ga22831 [Eleusine coracana subsp. coracana]
MPRKSSKKAAAITESSSSELEIPDQLQEFSKSNITNADLNTNWKDEWFYYDNPPHILADFSGAKETPQAQWSERPDPADPQVVALLEKITELKSEGVDDNDEDDEEESRQDSSLPTLVHSDQPSSLSEPPCKSAGGATVANKTDEATKSSLKRKDTDSQTTSTKKRVCRIKIKQASSGRSSDTQSAQGSQDTWLAPTPRPIDPPQPVRTPSSAQTEPRKSPNAPPPKPLPTPTLQIVNPSRPACLLPIIRSVREQSAEIIRLKKKLEETEGKLEDAKSNSKSFKCNLATLDYIHANQVEKTGHSLEYLLEHAPEVIANNTRRVATEAGSQVLVICQSWSPALPLNKIKEGFNPDLTVDQCQLLMDSMLETSHALVNNVEVDPIVPTPPATPELELQDDTSSPS